MATERTRLVGVSAICRCILYWKPMRLQMTPTPNATYGMNERSSSGVEFLNGIPSPDTEADDEENHHDSIRRECCRAGRSNIRRMFWKRCTITMRKVLILVPCCCTMDSENPITRSVVGVYEVRPIHHESMEKPSQVLLFPDLLVRCSLSNFVKVGLKRPGELNPTKERPRVKSMD